MDSCRPRKLEPGLAQMYSKPSDLMTSVMKSAPGRSVVRASRTGGVPVSTSLGIGRTAAGRDCSGCCALAAGLLAASAAALPAAVLRKLRRSSDVFRDLAMAVLSHNRPADGPFLENELQSKLNLARLRGRVGQKARARRQRRLRS